MPMLRYKKYYELSLQLEQYQQGEERERVLIWKFQKPVPH